MNTETNFMSFENLTKLIEEHKKETHPYKRYEFDGTSYTLLLISINNVIKENQELKKKYENAVADYETTMFEKKQLNSLVNSCQEEIRLLKKQVEEYKNENKRLGQDKLEYLNKFTKMLSSQDKFIKYLEDEIYSIEPKGTGINYNCEYDSEEDYVMAMQEQSRLNTLKEILQKCKSIVGDDKK